MRNDSGVSISASGKKIIYICLIIGLVLATGCATTVKPEEEYRNLYKKVQNGNTHIRSAIATLDHYGNSVRGFDISKQAVKTKDGDDAEVIFLEYSDGTIPGHHLSMAFLLIKGCVIDWKSCGTSTRNLRPPGQIEDVNGDNHMDLSFRDGPGVWSVVMRKDTSSDDIKWVYAYTIESQGFKSIPLKETGGDSRNPEDAIPNPENK